MKIKTLCLWALTIISSLFLFQNCGSFSEEASTANPSELDVPNDEKFKAGDPFDYVKIPYNLDANFKKSVEKYSDRTGYKALALAANGLGSIRSSDAFMDQDDANLSALQDCQLLTKLPCSLFAEGDIIKYSEKMFYQNHSFWIEDVEAFDPMLVPGHARYWRIQNNYLTRTNPYKAYAIGLQGATASGWSDHSQSEANRRALEFCEAHSFTFNPCTLYAVGNNVVFNSSDFNWAAQQIRGLAPDALNVSKIPFVRDIDRTGHIKDQYNKISASQHLVIAITRYGHYRAILASTLAQARQTALNECNAALEASANFECFVYSENKKIVMTIESFRRSWK